MIENSKKSYDPDTIKASRKDYYLLVVDHKPMGICTRFETAQACAKCYAKKYDAREIDGDDVYIFEDEYGKHLITIESIKRIRMPYSQEED